MKIRRILSLVLALVLCSAMALAEEGDLQSELDAANARIAELEAQVELYQPYYDAQVIVEYDGGVIFLDDVLAQYEPLEENYYNSYGISLADYGYDVTLKQQIAEELLRQVVLDMKAAELGLDQIDDETMATLEEQAASNLETYISSISAYFSSEDATEEEIRQSAIDALASLGYTQEALLDSIVASYVNQQVYDYVTDDITVSDEDVQAAFDELVAEQESSFADDATYNNSRNNGDTIVWNPEGYRAVKHVLIRFDDDQAARYDELQGELDTLNAELEEATAPDPTPAPTEEPVEETAEATAETAEETAETAEATAETAEATEETAEATAEAVEETVEATAEPEPTEEPARPAEEISADIAAVEEELDALYAELLPKAEEVVDAFNAGTPFADLIEQYNQDPGMQNEPTASNGYAVSANSTAWDPAFTEGAMSISAIGGISEPVYGQNGIHIIYYESDIPAGAVDLESVRAEIEQSALDTKISETYEATVTQWVAEYKPVYHFDRL